VLFCITSLFGGGVAAPMHRTLSLDYAVVLSGEIVLVLEGGKEKTVKVGEIIVNAGTMHSWVNRGQKECRLLCVMLGADKIALGDGTMLEAGHA
jgi:quercetin dioxygenase-like cupin family protein